MKKLFLTSDLPRSYKSTIKHMLPIFRDLQIVHANDTLMQKSLPFEVALHIARFSYDVVMTRNLVLCERIKDLAASSRVIVLPGNATQVELNDLFSIRVNQINNFIRDDASKLFLYNSKQISTNWY